MQHDYEKYVTEALTSPGQLHAAYSAFHNYSLGNQILALFQLDQAQPINTYQGWKALGRQVQKNAKAIQLVMPVATKAKNKDTGEDEGRTIFIAKRHWFPLSATEGTEFSPTVPEFSVQLMLAELKIKQDEFRSMNGNSQGYA